MKSILLGAFVFVSLFAQSQAEGEVIDTAGYYAEVQVYIDSIEKTFTYQSGTIDLNNGMATMTVPSGFEYLDSIQAKRVLEELWGNPPQETLGLLVPAGKGVLSEDTWAFEISWDGMGYVEDDDAEDMNYEEVLTQMKADVVEENKMREQQGYETYQLIGWASPPFYDAQNKVIHWAKEIKFSEEEKNTLNYNIRVLGRKGVLVINAIGTIDQLPRVAQQVMPVMTAVKFNEGERYEDFDSSVDEVAAYSVGGLVAGKIIAKAGGFALLAKFWKFILMGLIAAGGFIWRLVSGRKKDEAVEYPTNYTNNENQ